MAVRSSSSTPRTLIRSLAAESAARPGRARGRNGLGGRIGAGCGCGGACGAPDRALTAAPRRSSAAAERLTAREQEVARLVAAGASNRDIAAALVIGERTAETHVAHPGQARPRDARAKTAGVGRHARRLAGGRVDRRALVCLPAIDRVARLDYAAARGSSTVILSALSVARLRLSARSRTRSSRTGMRG